MCGAYIYSHSQPPLPVMVASRNLSLPFGTAVNDKNMKNCPISLQDGSNKIVWRTCADVASRQDGDQIDIGTDEYARRVAANSAAMPWPL